VTQPTMVTLQALAENLEGFGRRRALGLRRRYGTRWWTYQELHEQARWFATQLKERGVGPSARVLLWATNSPEWVAAALGVILRGAVLVPVDAESSSQWAQRLVDEVRPALIVHGPQQDPSRLGIPTVSLGDLAHVRDSAVAQSDAVAIGPDDEAVILYTSGSTHQPHGVVLTHRNLATQAEAFDRWRLLTRHCPLRLLTLSPLSHVQGFLIGMAVPLRLGMTVIYTDAIDPDHVFRTIRQNRVNLLLAVPAVQHLLAQAMKNRPSRAGLEGGPTLAERAQAIRFFPWRRHVLFRASRAQLGHSLWVVLVGGAALDQEDERFWYECGYVLVQGYGLTETSALISLHVSGPFRRRLGPIGKALPHQEIRLAADGEIWVRGPNVSKTESGSDGWFHTGDLATPDRRGELWFRGRKKDIIVTAEGLNIYPGDVEARLRTCVGVRDAVVLEQPGPGGAGIHAVLLLNRGVSAQAVVGAANHALEPYQRIRSWTVWPAEDLPRTSLLKVRRDEVARTVRDRASLSTPLLPSDSSLGGPDQVPSVEDVRAEGDRRRRLELLARRLASAPFGLPRHSLGDASLEELGLGSLDVAELLDLTVCDRPGSLDGLIVHGTTRLSDLEAMVRSAAAGGIGERPRSRLPVHQPGWSAAVPGRLLRRVTAPVLIGAWARYSVRLTTERAHASTGLAGPCIVAAAPHHHWLDAFAVWATIPRRWRVVTVTNRDFSEWFAPDPRVRWQTRLGVGLAYRVLWPLVFSFVIVPNFGSTRIGLYDLGRAIDVGMTPISFPQGLVPYGESNGRHQPGIAMMALETGLPIVPVWIISSGRLRVWPGRIRPHVMVRMGEPIVTAPTMTVDGIVERIEAAFNVLRGEAD
jgi:long-chain acyl-CoA synthetase